MRFLVPIIVLIVTAIFLPRQQQEQPEKAMAAQEYAAELMEMTGATDEAINDDDTIEYDEVIESAGMLNRLELFDF